MKYNKEIKKELLKEHNETVSQMNFPNKFFKIEYLQLDCDYWDVEEGRFINGEYYINGKIYSQNNLWCDNDSEVIEHSWYNTKNKSVEEITNDFYERYLFERFGVQSECLSIKVFGEDEYNEMMNNKIVLSDLKSSWNSIPQLYKEIERFGYDKVMETLKSLEWVKTDGIEDFIRV